MPQTVYDILYINPNPGSYRQHAFDISNIPSKSAFFIFFSNSNEIFQASGNIRADTTESTMWRNWLFKNVLDAQWEIET